MSVSTVVGVFFNRNGELLTIRNSRGIDVPGGHTEGKETIEQTIIRETYEEAGAIIKNIRIIDEVRTQTGTYRGKSMAFVTGEVISFDKKKAKFLAISAFLEAYTQNKQMMSMILQKVKRI